MKRKFLLVFLVIIIIGIQSVFSQSGSDASSKPAETARESKESVIHITLASDSEFTQALQAATDVELVHEDAVKNEKSDKNPNQGKSK